VHLLGAITSSVLLFALLVTADPVVSTPAPSPLPAKTAAKAKKQRTVCRIPLQQTGTRMQRKISRTEIEWTLIEEGASEEDLKSIGSR